MSRRKNCSIQECREPYAATTQTNPAFVTSHRVHPKRKKRRGKNNFFETASRFTQVNDFSIHVTHLYCVY